MRKHIPDARKLCRNGCHIALGRVAERDMEAAESRHQCIIRGFTESVEGRPKPVQHRLGRRSCDCSRNTARQRSVQVARLHGNAVRSFHKHTVKVRLGHVAVARRVLLPNVDVAQRGGRLDQRRHNDAALQAIHRRALAVRALRPRPHALHIAVPHNNGDVAAHGGVGALHHVPEIDPQQGVLGQVHIRRAGFLAVRMERDLATLSLQIEISSAVAALPVPARLLLQNTVDKHVRRARAQVEGVAVPDNHICVEADCQLA
mmetsp:Transcript_34947/g.87950  ORF Transcript_34947/g.87950 Transcript_34947/m.87950 type:complete len:260 (-) Transcript_34947:19-798(-)